MLQVVKNYFVPERKCYAKFCKSNCYLYIILLVCVLYVTLSMRISAHNKSPELFTVKPESHSRRQVRHWALEQKVPDRYARRRFHSHCLLWFSCFFPFLFFSPSVFLLQFFSPFPPLIPFPSPLLKILSPTLNLNLWIFHGSLPESTWFRYVHYKSSDIKF